MCLEMPARVQTIVDRDHAIVDVDGTAREVGLTVLNLEGEAVGVGDWLLVHTGYAVRRLDPVEAAARVSAHRRLHRMEERR